MREDNILDNMDKFLEVDSSNMLKLVLDTPNMILSALDLSKNIVLKKIGKFEKIVISGMGGSGVAGDLVNSLVGKTSNIPIYANRDYFPLSSILKGSLFFALSYSGNTEETLKSLNEAEKLKLPIVCITSGGELARIAENKGYLLVRIPTGLPPRAALPYMLIPLLVILEKLGLLKNLSAQIDETTFLLRTMREECNLLIKQMAKKMLDKVPVILACSGTTDAIGYRWKCQFNENSKRTALLSIFPELNHNEIVNLAALEKGKHNFALLILRDEEDSERNKKRIEITKSLISGQLGGSNEIWSRGKSKLARMFSLIYFGDMLSVYLAVLSGVDPTPVDVITRLKKELIR